MIQDPNFYIITGAFAVLCVGHCLIAQLARVARLDCAEACRARCSSARFSDAPVPSATSRIEVADLKERVKKLEAIAAGD